MSSLPAYHTQDLFELYSRYPEGSWMHGAEHQKHYDEFIQFHHENPEVAIRLTEMARVIRFPKYHGAKQLKKYSIKGIFETLRYRTIETTGKPYKLNNNATSFYSRWIMDAAPDLDGFFNVRGW